MAGNAAEIVNTTTRATNITSGTRFSLSATAPTTFSRPEDGSWNPLNPNEYFFVTTDQLDTVSDGLGTQVGRSRLWRLTFDDIKNPDGGGRIDLLLDGTEGGNMFDNLTLDKAGHVLLQEDTGNAAHNAKMWQYDIATDKLTLLTKFDPARFGDTNLAATAPFTVDEETSGIIDMEDILGPGWFLFDAQAHYTTGIAPELVEGGQLLALYNPALDQKLFKDTTTDVFNMPANGSKLNVSLQVKSNAVSEVGVFVVDNSSGAIRGVLPGAPGYEQLALEQIGRGNGRVIASNLAYLPSGFKLNLGDLTRILPFAADSNLRFYSLAAGTTTDDALNGKGAFQFSKVQQVKDLGGGQFTADFKDLALNITTSTTAIPTATSLQGGKQSEVLDLRDSLTAGGALKASFTVSRDAALDNLLGFYVVDDQTGRIGSLTPSDAGYLQAAMATRVPNLNLRVANQATAVFDTQLTTGKLYAPFMVIQDTVEGVLAGRTNQVYFPYASANPDKLDHIRLLGNNVFGFEDLGGGGDRDFNDMLVKVQLTA